MYPSLTTICGFRWAPGLITVAALEANDLSLIENWPWQADQNAGKPWLCPADTLTTFPRPARVVTMLDGSRQADGPFAFDVGFVYLTEGQMWYTDAYFGFTDTIWSADATIKHRNRHGDYQYFQGTLWRPVPGEDFKRGDLGAEDVVFHFVNGTAIT